MATKEIRLLILDVDGVLTDGRIVFHEGHEPAKAFCVQDGSAVKLWQREGGTAALLSGRDEASVGRRAAELGIEIVVTGASNKLAGLDDILRRVACRGAETAYIGDDLPDVAPMRRCGFPIAVASAVPAVKRAAAYVTRRRGGEGAVAEAVELLLRRMGGWPREAAEP